MINKCEPKMRMDPDSPLNRGHQMERQAERMVAAGQHQRATALYEEAAEHLQAALQQTRDPAALLSLKLQLEHLQKQPQLIAKRQQWSLHKQDSVLTIWNGRFETGADDDDVADGPGDEREGGLREAGAEPGRLREAGPEPEDYSAEETDSLLAMIRQHRVVEDEQPRYRLAQLLQGFRTLGPGRRGSPDPRPLQPDRGPAGAREGVQGPRTMVEELLQQNRELQSHLVQLFQVLDGCERENQQLKRTVAELSRQLEDCRALPLQAGVGGSERFGVGSGARLEAPFSMVDGFACTPPSESLPPLPPLLLPDFDPAEDLMS